jgi:hypothetical protein
MKLISTSSKPALLFAAGLGVPSMQQWVFDAEEGEARAAEWIKKHPADPAYVLKVLKHFQGTVNVYEVSTE